MENIGATVAADPESPHLRRDRWHRRCPHHIAARATGWTAQLGLPLLLAAGRHDDVSGDDVRRLFRRGTRVARLVVAKRSRKPPSGADHVWTCGRAPTRRMGGGVVAWL